MADPRYQEASRKLREAAFLANENADVQAAFLAIHNEETRSPLLDLCRKYALYHDNKAGEEAVKYLRSSEAINANGSALECLQLILESVPSALSPSQDAIIAGLASTSLPVRQYFAKELQASTTEFFDNVYERGDDAANCLRSVVLEPSLWVNEAARLHVEDELFQLFLAKLMESGHDHDGRALKGIALLLLADTQRLYSFVDQDAFDALMTSLDFRLPADVRGQATLILSKFLEADEAAAHQYYQKFITSHVARSKGDDLIMAFSAAALFFPLAPAVSAQLFLTEGFLVSILPLLEKQFNTTMVHDTFLALLNAACMDNACRISIAQYCSSWLSHKVSNGKGKQPSMAATVLAKLRTSGAKPGDQKQATKADDDVSELVDLFTDTLKLEEGRNISDSIEGLAYTSLRPQVKERLAKDRSFLKQLLQALDANAAIPEIVVGGLSIASNLTHFPPNLSEEQKRMTQLKAYANASKPTDPSPLEDEEHIKARCSALVEAGIMPTLVKLNKSTSSAMIHLTDQILLSLTRNAKDRGRLAQQGAIKLLVSHAQKALQSKSDTPPTDAAHALARALISLNPTHVFVSSGTPHITDAIPPLTSLLKPPSAGPLSDAPRDLLPVFESLLALTNLASSPDPVAANNIIRLAFDDIEDLLLHNNVLLRRAATELICNLTPFPGGAAKFADGTTKARKRVHLLLAMADVEDIATRRAAGGALAMLVEYGPVIEAIIALERGLEIVLGLVGDGDQGVVHRGLVVLAGVVGGGLGGGDPAENGPVAAGNETGIEKAKQVGGVEIVKKALRATRDEDVLRAGVDVLKVLTGASGALPAGKAASP